MLRFNISMLIRVFWDENNAHLAGGSKMKQKQTSSESGQVLVILVLVIVGLLAFTALAIDGGLVFSDRRGGQNAADASVLAGGYRIANSLDDYELNITMDYESWDCESSEIATAINLGTADAVSQATKNGYPIAGDSSLAVFCQQGEDFGSYVDKYIDSTAEIVSQVDTAFVHFAFGGPMQNTVQAISRVRPRMPLAFGYAVYAHRDDCPNSNTGGVHFTGNNTVNIVGGGIMSDACMDANGSVNVNVTGGDINYLTDYNPSGNPQISPPPTQQNYPIPEWALLFSEPDCSTLPTASFNTNGANNPGVYNSNITINGNDIATLNPGLYCFGANVTINGGTVTGNDVTLYMMSGDLSVSGNSITNLSAPNFVEEPEDGISGMLIYIADDNAGIVDLAGNGDSSFVGTIFGSNPDSEIHIGGTSDAVFQCQLIAGTVFIHGGAIIDVSFNDDQAYILPSRLTLEK
jgi:hypothetical protein